MIKAVIIILLAVAVVGGGLLTLRRSGRAGMPSAEVLERAAKRAREQAAQEEGEESAAKGRNGERKS